MELSSAPQHITMERIQTALVSTNGLADFIVEDMDIDVVAVLLWLRGKSIEGV